METIFNIVVGWKTGRYEALAIAFEEVALLASDFVNGHSVGWLDGRQIWLNELTSFIVFDIDRKLLPTEMQEVSNWEVQNYLLGVENDRDEEDNDPMALVVNSENFFIEYGKIVTGDFILGPHGSRRPGNLVRKYLQNNQLGVSKELPSLHQRDTDSQVNLKLNKVQLFISHASKDKKIVDQFVDEVLERGLGVDAHTDVYYTSSHVTGIRAGADFREDIRQGLIGAKIVFCFLSENYAASQYCIAELGAAWAFDKVIIPIMIPPKSKMQGGELYAILQAIDGGDRVALNRLRDDLVSVHGVGKRIESSAKWEKALGKFLEAIAQVETVIDTAGKK